MSLVGVISEKIMTFCVDPRLLQTKHKVSVVIISSILYCVVSYLYVALLHRKECHLPTS